MDQTIVTIVGGGAFAPRLCEALARAVELPDLELRISARRTERVRILAEHSARRLAPLRPGWKVRAAPLDAALEGAAIVILLVRVGGLEARAWDETFAARFGMAGDEGLGPGGIANAWRTLPELRHIAGTIQRIAPAARVINLMAPLGITTRMLLQQGLDTLGLCELPQVTIESWLAGAEQPAAATWRYGGLNHLGWFWNVVAGGEELLGRLAVASAPAGRRAPIDRATFEHFRAAPLRYFYEIFDREAGQRLGLDRPPGRARQLIHLSDALVRRFSAAPGGEAPEADARLTPWLDGAIAPVVSALLGGPSHEGFVNLRNEHQIPELPPELVVEVAATFSSRGARPVTPGPLPRRVADFLRAAGRSETLTFAAADRQDPELLTEAIRALPLPITEAAVQELTTLAQRTVEGA